MQNRQLWQQSVDMIIKSIWIYTIATILAAIFGGIDSIIKPVNFMQMLSGEGGGGAVGTLETICNILAIVGYVLFFINIKKFTDAQTTEQDRQSAKNIYLAYLLLILAIVVGFIPVVGGIGALVLIIISYVKMFSGYKGLRDSATLLPEAKNGAGILYKCTLWVLIGAILNIIPFVGGFLDAVINIVAFFYILSGWKQIGEGAPLE